MPEEITCELVGHKYLVSVGNRKAILPHTPGKILSILMARRDIHTCFLVDSVYGHRADGGPSNAEGTIKVHIYHLRKHLRKAGINLDLRSSPWKGYEYHGASTIDILDPTQQDRKEHRN